MIFFCGFDIGFDVALHIYRYFIIIIIIIRRFFISSMGNLFNHVPLVQKRRRPRKREYEHYIDTVFSIQYSL